MIAGPVAAAWSKHGAEAAVQVRRPGRAGHLRTGARANPLHEPRRPRLFHRTVRGTRGWAETDLFQPHLRVVVPRKGGQQLSPLVNQFVNGAGWSGQLPRLPQ